MPSQQWNKAPLNMKTHKTTQQITDNTNALTASYGISWRI